MKIAHNPKRGNISACKTGNGCLFVLLRTMPGTGGTSRKRLGTAEHRRAMTPDKPRGDEKSWGERAAHSLGVGTRDVLEGDAGPSLIVRGKGDKQRIVPISEDLAKRITAAPGWLFPGRWRGHVEKSYVSRHLTRLLPDGWGPHSLRHRYATRMYETTHDLLLVSKLLGHSSVETTQIYVAMPDSRLRVGLDAVTLAG